MTQCGWWTRIQTTTLTFARMRTFLFQSRFHRQYSELRSSSHQHENDCNCIHTSPFTESLDYLPHLTATDHIISRWIQCVDWRFCAWPASLWLDHWVVSRCYMLATRYLDKPLNLGHTKTAWGQHKKQINSNDRETLRVWTSQAKRCTIPKSKPEPYACTASKNADTKVNIDGWGGRKGNVDMSDTKVPLPYEASTAVLSSFYCFRSFLPAASFWSSSSHIVNLFAV